MDLDSEDYPDIEEQQIDNRIEVLQQNGNVAEFGGTRKFIL